MKSKQVNLKSVFGVGYWLRWMLGVMVLAAWAFVWTAGVRESRAATTDTWTTASGSWSTSANWTNASNGHTVPAAGDTVNITLTNGTPLTVTYNFTGAAISLGNLTLDLTGGSAGATATFTMPADNLTVVQENIGDSGAGSNGTGTFNQSGGTNSAIQLQLGVNGTDAGYYNLSNGTFALPDGDDETVGLAGIGVFNQTGGTNNMTLDGQIIVGAGVGSNGTYELSGSAVLEQEGQGGEIIGSGGIGSFIQTGGSNSLNGESSIVLGNSAGGTGTYTLSAGTVSSTSHGDTVGMRGTGTFTQTGGTNTADAEFEIGDVAGSVGTYNLSGTGQLIFNKIDVGEFEAVGVAGAGTFNQTGGSNTINADLVVGQNSGGVGNYYLSGGTLSTGSITLGLNSGASGSFYLSGTGAITATGNVLIASSGSGAFYQSGGTHTLSGPGSVLEIGVASGTTGIYVLSGGSLTVSNSGNEYVGYSGTGFFNQTGGSNTATGDSGLDLGFQAGASGYYTLSGTATLSVSGATEEFIGQSGTGTFTQTGGTNTIGGGAGFFVAQLGGSIGTYIMSGGNLNALDGEILGGAGNATFNQSGGTNTVGNDFVIADGNNSVASYFLSGTGTLNVSADNEAVGLTGNGSFVQTGGTHTLNTTLFLGEFAGSIGSYALSGGSLSVGFSEFIGSSGKGTFAQTGGSNTLSGGILSVGSQASANGTYILTAGTLSLLNSAQEIIGDSGIGDFTQNGGTHSIGAAVSMILGNAASGNGTYLLAGTGLLLPSGSVVVGALGTGTFIQTGGTLDFFGTQGLTIASSAGSAGTFTLSGTGVVSSNPDEVVGGGGTGTFTQSGGTNTLNGASVLRVGLASGGTGHYVLSGGTLNAPTITVQPGSTFTYEGGTLNTVTMNLAGNANLALPGIMGTALKLSTLSLPQSGQTFTDSMDIAFNKLVVESTPAGKAAEITNLQSAVQSGRNGGTWTGTGITSSAVAEDAATATAHSYHTTLAIVDNGAYPAGARFTVFGGEPVDANSILVTRALVGDSNLDGTVNNTDLVALLTHFTESGQTQATGDYNGDGVVNNTDLVALLTDYTQTLPAGFGIAPAASGGVGTAAPAPEPGALWLFAAGALLLAIPRRRGSRGSCGKNSRGVSA